MVGSINTAVSKAAFDLLVFTSFFGFIIFFNLPFILVSWNNFLMLGLFENMSETAIEKAHVLFYCAVLYSVYIHVNLHLIVLIMHLSGTGPLDFSSAKKYSACIRNMFSLPLFYEEHGSLKET